jgi:hypothetical protein
MKAPRVAGWLTNGNAEDVKNEKRFGERASGRRNPGTVGRKTRRAQGSVPLPPQSAPVLSRGMGCDTAQEKELPSI